MLKLITPENVLKYIKFWPPYLAAGISVKSYTKDLTEVVVQMKQRKSNTNYVGSHFGGSLYSMCDPFFMFMLLHHLKEEHIVWDSAANIEFIKPGKGTVTAVFKITLEEINAIKEQALNEFSIKPKFYVEVRNKDDEVIAKIDKTLYVRRKDAKERFKT